MPANYIAELQKFIAANPTAFHVRQAAADIMDAIPLDEKDAEWKLEPGKSYSVSRNGSTIAAFRVPRDIAPDEMAFRIGAAHTDSPAFKVKTNPEIYDQGYVRLNVEGYGGMIRPTWFDRPLAIAGRVFATIGNNRVREHVIHLDGVSVIIPSLAIHMSKPEDAKKEKVSIQREMLPVIGQYDEATGPEPMLMPLIAAVIGCDVSDIVSHDLFLIDADVPRLTGLSCEFLSAPRLDDQACTFAVATAFSEAAGGSGSHVPMAVLFDNEEVGSNSKQGADSDFLPNLLERVSAGLGLDRVGHMAVLARSCLVSADNAHAVHPAYVDRADIVNRPKMNGGIVLKYAANQHYCTDGLSAAAFYGLCKEAGVPVQDFHNNGDVAGGSTLGNIALGHVSVPAVDIGIPQLAMHSAYETCGTSDIVDMVRFFKAFFG